MQEHLKKYRTEGYYYGWHKASFQIAQFMKGNARIGIERRRQMKETTMGLHQNDKAIVLVEKGKLSWFPRYLRRLERAHR